MKWGKGISHQAREDTKLGRKEPHAKGAKNAKGRSEEATERTGEWG